MGNCVKRISGSENVTSHANNYPSKIASAGASAGRAFGEIPDHELQFVFSQFDVNGDGFITESELRQVMLRLGQEPNADEIRAMFKAADANRDGKISFEEFSEIARANPMSLSLKSVFNEMDRDNDGHVTRKEMHEALKRMGHVISPDELNAIYKAADVDKNSKIDFDEEYCVAIMARLKAFDPRQYLDVDSFFRNHAFPRRYILTFWAFVGFCVLYSMRVNLSIAILFMTRNATITDDDGNTTTEIADFHDWDSVNIGFILSGFFYGYILTQFPAGWLACRFGGKRLLGCGTVACSVLTMLTPGVSYPSMQAIWSHWAPENEKSRLSGIVFSGSFFGTVIASPLTSVIAQRFNWTTVFYVSGICGCIWSSIWLSTIAETPRSDGKITEAELEFIENDKVVGNKLEAKSVPWKELITSKAVWAIIAVHTTENWGFYTMLTYLPAYMNDVLGFKLESTGFTSALPYLAMGILLQVGGYLADYINSKKIITLELLRKLMASGGLFVQVFFTVILTFTVNYIAATILMTFCVGFGGVVWASFSINQLDIAPQYASVIMGISNTFATLPGMISPSIVGAIVQKGVSSEWCIIFYITAAFYAIGGVVFALFAKAEVQPWAKLASKAPDTPENEDAEEFIASTNDFS
ncbi:sialin [Trichinella spiralis]|uniref:sialin n=1 Tax=Trichinella spiralis TaxID=6334 RepID=UPI0001EFC27A|nr:sialin [Trichinella spiralis]